MMYHQSLFIVSITHKYTMYIIIESFIVSIPHMYTMYIPNLFIISISHKYMMYNPSFFYNLNNSKI